MNQLFDPNVLQSGQKPGLFTEETIRMTKEALANADSALAKGITTSNPALVGYPLIAPSKKLYPFLSPIRNRLQRIGVAQLAVGGMAGTALNWKQISAINASKLWPSVAAGARNSAITYTETDKSQSFKTIGLDDLIDDEAIWAGRGFEDVRALSALATLQAVMIMEEYMILGGNTVALGAPTGLAAVASASGGSLATNTYKCQVSALTMQGYFQGAQGNGGADALGETTPATQTSTAVTGPTGSLALTWTAVRGAFAYNVYIDDGAAGAKRYNQTVFVNAATVTNNPAGNAPNGVDKTANALDFQGFVQQVEAASAGYYKSLDNAALTADGAGGIVEFDTALQSLWDNQRIGPNVIYVNSQEATNVNKKLTNAGSSSITRVVVENTPAEQGSLMGGSRTSQYLNKYTGQIIPIQIHPFLAPGKIAFETDELPPWFPNNNVGAQMAVVTLNEYADYDFARTTRQTPHGVYVAEALVMFAPAFCAVITNIKNG